MRPTNFQMAVLCAVTVFASATGSCKEYPFEETDPDSNGRLGVMTREPDGAVAAGSVVFFDVHGPSQYHAAQEGGDPGGWQFPETRLDEVSSEPTDVLEAVGVRAARVPEGDAYSEWEWVPFETVASEGREQFRLMNRLLVKADQPGTGELSVSARVPHNDKTYDVEDIFEIWVEPVQSLEARLDDGSELVLAGEEFVVEYYGTHNDRPLRGFGYFNAEVEPEGSLIVDDVTLSGLLSGEDELPNRVYETPHLTATATQTSSIVLRSQPSGTELALEAIEPSAVNRLSVGILEEGQSLGVPSSRAKSIWFAAWVDDRQLYWDHQELLGFRVEVLDVDDATSACLVRHSGIGGEYAASITLEPQHGNKFTVGGQQPGHCQIRITHLLHDGSAGASTVVPVEVQ